MARQELEIVNGRGISRQKIYLEPVRKSGVSPSLHIENLTLNILVAPRPLVKKKVVVKRIRFRATERAFDDRGRLFTAATIISVTAALLIASF